MLTVRRLYVYLVAAASLALLVVGLTGAATVLVELLLSAGGLESTYRQTIATFGAETAVALPLWVLHWRFAQRLAGHDPIERAATLRRLYLYGVLAALLVALGGLAYNVLDGALGIALGAGNQTGESTAIGLARTLLQLAIVAAFWAYTLRIADADRTAVGESGGSATLRRWYVYGAQFVALLVGLFGAAALLSVFLVDLFTRATVIGDGMAVASGVAQTLVGLGIWLFQRNWSDGRAFAAADRHSALRAVYGFGIVAVAVAATLVSIGQILYWILARLLGVPQPSGLPGDAVAALGSAFSMGVVFGAAWALTRRDLARDAAGAEAERQAGVRRLYEHLVALVALGTFASGTALLLWALVDQFVGPGVAITTTDFRDRISLSVTALLVGLPVWLLHWRPAAPIEERLSLSRRLYVFASLLVSVLAALGSGVWLASQLLSLLLRVGSPYPAVEIGHALGLLLVALAVMAYHARVLWEDNSFRVAHSRAEAQVTSGKPPGTVLPGPIEVEITGATEEEVRTALGALPAGATYQLRLS